MAMKQDDVREWVRLGLYAAVVISMLMAREIDTVPVKGRVYYYAMVAARNVAVRARELEKEYTTRYLNEVSRW